MRKATIKEVKRLGKTVWQLDRLHPTKLDTAGNPARFKKIYPTEEEARQADATFILMEREGPTSSTSDPFITVEEYAQRFLKTYEASKRSQGTIRNMRCALDIHIIPAWGKRKMVDIHEGMIRELVYGREGMNQISQESFFQRLSVFLSWAVESKVIAQNPAKRMGKRLWSTRGGKAEIKAMDANQMALFFETCLQHHPILFPIYATLGWMGLRIGELLHLQVKDVTEDYLYVRNHNGHPHHLKTSKSKRNVEVSPDLWKVLEAYRERAKGLEPTSWFFFPADLPHPMDKDSEERVRKFLLHKMKRILKRTGSLSQTFNLHSFRHSFASQHIARGTSPKWVQQMLGHSTLSMTTETYGDAFQAKAPGATKEHSGESLPLSLRVGKGFGKLRVEESFKLLTGHMVPN